MKHGLLRNNHNNHQDVIFSNDLKLSRMKMEALIIAVQIYNVLKNIQCLYRKKVQCRVLFFFEPNSQFGPFPQQ